jgi:hypothetical protein
MPQQRRLLKKTQAFQQLLAKEALRFKEAAEALPQGMARELLLRRVRQAEMGSHINEWLNSPGLRSPT